MSVQRVHVREDVYDAFRDALAPQVEALKVVDPLDEATDVGPVIDIQEMSEMKLLTLNPRWAGHGSSPRRLRLRNLYQVQLRPAGGPHRAIRLERRGRPGGSSLEGTLC